VSGHYEALEADLLAHYGLDLREGIGVRRLRALVQGLPPGGALHRSIDPDGWRWTTDTEMLATVAELVDANNRLFYSAHAKKGSSPVKPIKIMRPGKLAEEEEQLPRRKRKSTRDELKKFVKGNVVVGD